MKTKQLKVAGAEFTLEAKAAARIRDYLARTADLKQPPYEDYASDIASSCRDLLEEKKKVAPQGVVSEMAAGEILEALGGGSKEAVARGPFVRRRSNFGYFMHGVGLLLAIVSTGLALAVIWLTSLNPSTNIGSVSGGYGYWGALLELTIALPWSLVSASAVYSLAKSFNNPSQQKRGYIWLAAALLLLPVTMFAGSYSTALMTSMSQPNTSELIVSSDRVGADICHDQVLTINPFMPIAAGAVINNLTHNGWKLEKFIKDAEISNPDVCAAYLDLRKQYSHDKILIYQIDVDAQGDIKPFLSNLKSTDGNSTDSDAGTGLFVKR